MSIAKDFESRRMSVPMEEWNEHGTFKYWGDDVERLLKHTRALEVMLKKHEWCENDTNWRHCDECGSTEPSGHKHDCALAKLLEGVD